MSIHESIISVYGEVLRNSRSAIFVRIEKVQGQTIQKYIWLPLACIERTDYLPRKKYRINIPFWLAKDRGLIENTHVHVEEKGTNMRKSTRDNMSVYTLVNTKTGQLIKGDFLDLGEYWHDIRTTNEYTKTEGWVAKDYNTYYSFGVQKTLRHQHLEKEVCGTFVVQTNRWIRIDDQLVFEKEYGWMDITPKVQDKPYRGTLRYWSISQYDNKLMITGQVYGSDTYEDGHFIIAPFEKIWQGRVELDNEIYHLA